MYGKKATLMERASAARETGRSPRRLFEMLFVDRPAKSDRGRPLGTKVRHGERATLNDRLRAGKRAYSTLLVASVKQHSAGVQPHTPDLVSLLNFRQMEIMNNATMQPAPARRLTLLLVFLPHATAH